MKYLVMETHPAYAVVLDEEGRFRKAANLRYQVGDTVEDIIELRQTPEKRRAVWKPAMGLVGAAACLCAVFFGYYQPNFTAYGTLRIQINPDVEMTISRTERVLALEGLNADGADLIEGYEYQGKTRDTATDELVERAIDMGYLSDGDTITITVDSADETWRVREEAQVQEQLEDRYGESVVIELTPPQQETPSTPASTPTPEPPVEVVVPVAPQTPAVSQGDTDYGTGSEGVTDHEDTDYGPDADGVTDYEDTDYGPNADGVTDYEDTDYGSNADGVTDYEDTDYGPNADGVTDYEDTDYGPNADGVTDYEDTDYGPYNDGVTDYADRDDGGNDDDSDDDGGNDDVGNDDDSDDDDGYDDNGDDDDSDDDDVEDDDVEDDDVEDDDVEDDGVEDDGVEDDGGGGDDDDG